MGRERVRGIDEIDIQIIEVLMRNSKTTYKEIADIIGMSPMGALKRVKRLEDLGIIKGYTLKLDYEKIGKCMLSILIKVDPSYSPDKIATRLSNMSSVYSVYRLLGEFDLLIVAGCQGRVTIPELLDKLRNIEGVNEVRANLILRDFK